jgi:hypothetical protein
MGIGSLQPSYGLKTKIVERHTRHAANAFGLLCALHMWARAFGLEQG